MDDSLRVADLRTVGVTGFGAPRVNHPPEGLPRTYRHAPHTVIGERNRLVHHEPEPHTVAQQVADNIALRSHQRPLPNDSGGGLELGKFYFVRGHRAVRPGRAVNCSQPAPHPSSSRVRSTSSTSRRCDLIWSRSLVGHGDPPRQARLLRSASGSTVVVAYDADTVLTARLPTGEDPAARSAARAAGLPQPPACVRGRKLPPRRRRARSPIDWGLRWSESVGRMAKTKHTVEVLFRFLSHHIRSQDVPGPY